MAVSQSLTLEETIVDTLANTSEVKIVWKSTQTGESYNLVERTANYWITINGGEKKMYSVRYTLPLKKTKTILSTTIVVPHTEDGTGSVQVETQMDTRISAGIVKLSKTLPLTPIARASTIGATDAYIESTSTISISRKSNDYTNSVEFSFGDLVGYISEDGEITGVEIKHTITSIPFRITPVFYEYMEDKSSAMCELVCRTYNGDVLIGSRSASFLIKANPDLCRPLIRCSVKDANQNTLVLTGNPDVLVRYMSKALCTISAEALNGATIKTLKVNNVAVNDTYEVENVESGEFRFSATDSRGFIAEETVIKTLIPYMPPTLNAKVTRTDPTSGNALLEISGQCFSGSFGVAENHISVFYSINGSEQNAANVEISDDGMSYIVSETISGLHYMSTSNVSITLTDAVSEKTQPVRVKPGIPVFDWGKEDFAFHVPVWVQDVEILKELLQLKAESLHRTGDTMAGMLNMNRNTLTGLPQPEENSDAVPKNYADQKAQILKLWKNPEPTLAFAAQTLTVPGLAACDYVWIHFNALATSHSFAADLYVSKAERGNLANYATHVRYDGGVYVSTRSVTVNFENETIDFGTGTQNGSNNASRMIPMIVTGFQGIHDNTLAPDTDTRAICGTFRCGEVVAGQQGGK